MSTVPWWARQSASSGRCPVRSQNASSCAHHWPARSKSRARSQAMIMLQQHDPIAIGSYSSPAVAAAVPSSSRRVPSSHAAEADQREALERPRRHLDVEAAERTRVRGGLGAQSQHRGRIGVEMERRLDQRQPRVLRRRLEVLHEATGPLQPAVRDGVDAPHRAVVPGEEPGDARRLDGLAALATQDVRALARGDRRVDVVLPPARHREPLERLRASPRPPARARRARPPPPTRGGPAPRRPPR